MKSSIKNKNVFKSGLSKRPSDKILIGGADLSDIPSKENLIEKKINEAKEKVLAESQALLEEAMQKAAQIIEEAENKRDDILESSREEGFKQGHKDGLELAKQEVQDLLNTSKQILESVEKERIECIEDETNRIYKVICLIAKKIIKQDLTLNQEISLNFISQALKQLEYKSEVNVFINPVLAKKINSLKAEIMDSCPGLERISITASENLEPGDLILESNKERLDFRLESQLNELLKTIQN